MKKKLKESIKAKLRRKLMERKLMKEGRGVSSYEPEDIAQECFDNLYEDDETEIDADLEREVQETLDNYFIYYDDQEEMIHRYAESEYQEMLDSLNSVAFENAFNEVYSELESLVSDHNDMVEEKRWEEEEEEPEEEEEDEEEVKEESKNLKLKESARINMRRRILESRNSKRLNKSKLV